MLRVALVEDDQDLREELAFFLTHEGCDVVSFGAAPELDAWLSGHPLDVLVLDLGLPGEDGLSIAKRLRPDHPELGIIMLTARGELGDRVKGFEGGADHYLVKPVDLMELLAVINALQRRLGDVQHSGWLLDLSRMELSISTKDCVRLSKNECVVLSEAAKAQGDVVSRRTLIEAMGQDYWSYDERRLETLVSRLRRKLSDFAPKDGFVVRGMKNEGYLFGIELKLK